MFYFFDVFYFLILYSLFIEYHDLFYIYIIHELLTQSSFKILNSFFAPLYASRKSRSGCSLCSM